MHLSRITRRIRPALEPLENRLVPTVFNLQVNPAVDNAGAVKELIADLNTANGNNDPTGNTINLFPGATYTLSTPDNYLYGPDGLPAISSTLTINGLFATLQRAAGAVPFRFFYVSGGFSGLATGSLTLQNLTLANGEAKGGDSNEGGGGLGAGGAIFNQGTLTLNGVVLSGNVALGGSSGVAGLGGGGGGMGQSAKDASGGGFGGSFVGAGGKGIGGGGNFGSGGSPSGGGGGGGFVQDGSAGTVTTQSLPTGFGFNIQETLYTGSAGGGLTELGGAGGSGIELRHDAGAPDQSNTGAAGGDGGGGSQGGGGGGGGGGAAGGGGGGFGGGGGTEALVAYFYDSVPSLSGGGSGGFGGGAGYFGGIPGFGGGPTAPFFGGLPPQTNGAGGGGAGMGGAIFSMFGSVTIINSTLSGNFAIGGSNGGAFGGAVFNLNGRATVTSSVLSNNSVVAQTGVQSGVTLPGGNGGAIASISFGKTLSGAAGSATLAATNLTLTGNQNDGGIDVYSNQNVSSTYIQTLYQVELGRQPTTAELVAWENAPSSTAVAAGISQSLEAQEHRVGTWYGYMLRGAAPSEELYWAQLLTQGQSDEQVLSEILGGGEFYARQQQFNAGGTPDYHFVEELYFTLLGRMGTTAEINGWVALLPTIGQQGVVLGFVTSQEFRYDQIAADYVNLLHRTASAAELNAWALSGRDLRTIRQNVENSPEALLNNS